MNAWGYELSFASRRGEGIAHLLLQAAVDDATASGIKELKLETGRSEGFAASRRFYEKQGFTPCERYGRYGNDPFSFCMSRSL